MNFKLFLELYGEANKCESVDDFIDSRGKTLELKNVHEVDVVLLLRFIYEIAHMSIKDIREYLGLLRPQFCERYEIKMRTLEDWEYGKNPVPQRLLKLLAYTLVEDFLH